MTFEKYQQKVTETFKMLIFDVHIHFALSFS